MRVQGLDFRRVGFKREGSRVGAGAFRVNVDDSKMGLSGFVFQSQGWLSM